MGHIPNYLASSANSRLTCDYGVINPVGHGSLSCDSAQTGSSEMSGVRQFGQQSGRMLHAPGLEITAPWGQGPPPFPVESPPIMSLCIIESLPMCCSIQLAMSSHQPGEEVVETEARESVPIH